MGEQYIRKPGVVIAMFINCSKAEIEEDLYKVINIIKANIPKATKEDIAVKVFAHFSTIGELFECVKANRCRQFTKADVDRYNQDIAKINNALGEKCKELGINIKHR